MAEPAPVDRAPPRPATGGETPSQALVEVHVPDIGDFSDVPVIEVMVSAGDTLNTDDPVVTLESDKASMDVPTPFAGRVDSVHVKVGDQVSEGSLLITMRAAAGTSPGTTRGDVERRPRACRGRCPSKRRQPRRPARVAPFPNRGPRGREKRRCRAAARTQARPYATSPASLGVELERVKGTGRKGRILKDDLKRFVKQELTKPEPAASGSADPADAGGRLLEVRPGGRPNRSAGSRNSPALNLHRAWLVVPHVTQHDEADITELEAFRKSQGEQAKQRGVRLTLLAFLMKAAVGALKEFPNFNASLSPSGEELILKRYFHIGIAVDTPDGLVVPVIRNVDTKSVYELAEELGKVSAKARDGKVDHDRPARGVFLDLEPGRHRRHRVHTHRQRARGRHPRCVALELESPCTSMASSNRG